MKVVVIASQKGGVGKTTLTGHLGVQAAFSGQGPVALLEIGRASCRERVYGRV